MFFQIDFANELTIYDQVVRQIKFAVAGGVLKEGELIPSVRELARELTINPNTVARAYRQLQDDGVLDSVRGTGLAVAAGAAKRCREQRVELIRARLEQVLAEARQSGLDPNKLRALVEKQLARIESPHPIWNRLGSERHDSIRVRHSSSSFLFQRAGEHQRRTDHAPNHSARQTDQTLRRGNGARRRFRWKCPRAWCSPCWAKTGREKPPPSASCSAWPNRTPDRPKCWASAAPSKG